MVFNLLVDCEWDDWKIGICSKECGGGTRTNVRTPKIDAAHGGEECNGSSNITESCNTHECPGINIGPSRNITIIIFLCKKL